MRVAFCCVLFILELFSQRGSSRLAIFIMPASSVFRYIIIKKPFQISSEACLNASAMFLHPSYIYIVKHVVKSTTIVLWGRGGGGVFGWPSESNTNS